MRRPAFQVKSLAVGTALALGVVLAGPHAHSAPVGELTTFEAGTPASAAQVNGNFSAVRTAVDDNAGRIGSLEAAAGSPMPPIPFQCVSFGGAIAPFEDRTLQCHQPFVDAPRTLPGVPAGFDFFVTDLIFRPITPTSEGCTLTACVSIITADSTFLTGSCNDVSNSRTTILSTTNPMMRAPTGSSVVVALSPPIVNEGLGIEVLGVLIPRSERAGELLDVGAP